MEKEHTHAYTYKNVDINKQNNKNVSSMERLM